ncbi:MAG: hypothetical protein ABJJ20_01715, partial [Lentilitoribacter sp.]
MTSYLCDFLDYTEHGTIYDFDLQNLQRFKIAEAGNLFSLNLSSGRIGILAQHARAIELASLLHNFADAHAANPILGLSECKLTNSGVNLKEKARIAIIGGGISGTACLMSLKGLGFKKIDLFEASSCLLHKQKLSKHRHAHPVYNDWPLEEREFSSATNMPVLNWFADSVAEIIDTMTLDPNFDCLEDDDHVQFAKIVETIRPGKDELKDEINLEVRSPFSSTTKRIGPFDIVISAAGLGEERYLESSYSRSYWWPDYIPNLKSEVSTHEKHLTFVVGDGDGGLIDVLRLLAPLNDDHSERNVPWEIVAEARHDEAKVLDYDGQRTGKKSKIETEAKKLSKIGDTERFLDALQGDLSKFLEEHIDAEQFLENIFLVSKGSKPFAQNASLISKILFGFAVNNRREILLDGRWVPSSKSLQIERDCMTRAGLTPTKVKNGQKVIRIGPENPLGTKIKIDGISQKKKLKLVNATHGNFLSHENRRGADGDVRYNGILVDEFTKNLPFDYNSTQSAYFHEWRSLLISKYLRRVFGKNSTYEIIPATPETDAYVELQLEDTELNRSAYRRIGGFDRKLFGYNVKYSIRGSG